MDNIYKILESLDQVEEVQNKDEGVEEAMSADDINIDPIDHSEEEDGASAEDISSAITRRLMAHPKFGALVREIDIIDLNDAIEDVAQFHAGGDLGTSDVSNMVNDVLKQLKKEGALDESEVNEEEIDEGNAFITARDAAIAAGKETFVFNGRTYPVTDKDPKDVKRAEKRFGESVSEDYNKDEYDEEGEMAKNQLDVACDATKELKAMIEDDENLPEWVQKKITLAMDYLDTARDYLKSVDDDMETTDEVEFELEEGDTMKKISRKFMKAMSFGPQTDSPKDMQDGIRKMSDKELLDLIRDDNGKAPSGSAQSAQMKMIKRELRRRGIDKSVDLEEESKSRDQQQAAGAALSAKRGETPVSKLVGASKEMYDSMTEKELEDFAGTKHKGLPEKVKKKKTDETTVAGAVAVSADATGSSVYGNPSVYESMNSSVEQMITESMSVNVSDSTEGEPSVTVTATGEDAHMLSQLLQLAAVKKQPCPGCGRVHEGECMREEDEANSANNTETYDMEYLLNAISGGLNGQKRQINPNNPGDNPMSMDGNKTVNVEESEDVGVSHLEALYQEFKTR